MMPSREFLVRQAVLNAVPKCWPASSEWYGVGRTLKNMGCEHAGMVALSVLPFIRAEFYVLVARYEMAEVSYCK